MLEIDSKKVEQELLSYTYFDKNEEKHVSFVLDFLKKHQQNIGRENVCGHFTASAWIINSTKDKVILIEHKKLNRWLQPGGHIEIEDFSLLDAAFREAIEETNLTELAVLSTEFFDIDVHLIPERKNEQAHYHLDFRYCFIANEEEKLMISEEINNIKWISLKELQEIETEESILRMIRKTIQKQ